MITWSEFKATAGQASFQTTDTAFSLGAKPASSIASEAVDTKLSRIPLGGVLFPHNNGFVVGVQCVGEVWSFVT